MKELILPPKFDGQKYYDAHGDYPTSHKEGFLLVPDEITQEQINSYCISLDDEKETKIEKLWNSATNYEEKYISGSAPAKVGIKAASGDAKCIAIENWVLAIWTDYYVRKANALAATSEEELNLISEDFSSHGVIPYSVFEALIP